MRIAELSRRSGVPVATIKYYLREGLLPSGDRTAPNQADYGEAHVERLRLVRALREAADLPVATIARTLEVMDERGGADGAEHLGIAIGALSPPLVVPEGEEAEHERARRLVDDLVALLGWQVDEGSPGHDDLVRAMVAVERHLPGLVPGPAGLVPFAEAVRRLADVELPDTYDPGTDPGETLRYSVLGTVLFEPVLLALRRLGHVDRLRTLAARRRRG